MTKANQRESRHLQFGSDAGAAKIFRQALQAADGTAIPNFILSQAEPRIDDDSYLSSLVSKLEDA